MTTANFANTSVSMENYHRVIGQYRRFIDACNDPAKPPVTVFNPLTKVQLDEIQMIRELSKELQVKKNEDIRKQKEQMEEIEKQKEEEVAVDPEDPAEDTTTETTADVTSEES